MFNNFYLFWLHNDLCNVLVVLLFYWLLYTIAVILTLRYLIEELKVNQSKGATRTIKLKRRQQLWCSFHNLGPPCAVAVCLCFCQSMYRLFCNDCNISYNSAHQNETKMQLDMYPETLFSSSVSTYNKWRSSLLPN